MVTSLLDSAMGSRNWCFTAFNLGLKDRLADLPADITYLICQHERAPDTGREHLQGYVELRRPVRMAGLKRLLADETVHVEPRRGTRDSARDYCRKSDTRVDGPWEHGTWRATTQGHRSDLEAIKLLVDSGARGLDIAQQAWGAWLKHHRAIDSYVRLRDARVRELRTITVIHVSGDTGSGKSYWAHAFCDDAYRVAPPNQPGGPVWFDGYDGQKTIIIDDFDGWIPYRRFLTLLDPYPCALPVKGGMAWARYTRVVVTSIFPVAAWYPNHGTAELERRIARRVVMKDRVVLSDVTTS